MSKQDSSRIFAGMFIIALGFIFLLGSLGKLSVGSFIAGYWPLILVAVGCWQLLANRFRDSGPGIILIVLGAFFMLAKWDVFGVDAWKIFWPGLIIAAGLWVLLRPGTRGFSGTVPAVKEDDINTSVIFSGGSRRIESERFKGGRATALFGSLELDFTPTRLEGNQATVELTATFGGIGIRVPRDWKVVSESHALFGGVEDKRSSSVPAAENPPTLFIRATVLFGGIDVKD